MATKPDYLPRLIALFIKAIDRGFDHRSMLDTISSIPRQEEWMGRMLMREWSQGELSQVSFHGGRLSSALYWIRKIGRRLASELEKIGHNSTGVLTVVESADGGGGINAIGEVWKPIKVDLQRLVVQIKSCRPPLIAAKQTISRPQAAKLLGIRPKTLTNRASELPEPVGRTGKGVPIFDYATLRHALIEMYPDKAFLLPEDFSKLAF